MPLFCGICAVLAETQQKAVRAGWFALVRFFGWLFCGFLLYLAAE